ncbi:MAG: hypothetical protein AAFS10_14080, partial [Myxococcota bacterium]
EYAWDDDGPVEEDKCVRNNGTRDLIGRNKVTIINRDYNCGNEHLTLEDFSIDASLLNTLELTDEGEVMYDENGDIVYNHRPMVTISLASVYEAKLQRLYIKDAPQDAIFFRNGGNSSAVRDCVIDGFNRQWYNGAAINMEMQPNGRLDLGLDDPENDDEVSNLEIANNVIIARGPMTFCDSDGAGRACSSDSDCDDGVHCVSSRSRVQVDLINLNVTKKYVKEIGQKAGHHHVPNPTIVGNTLLSEAPYMDGIVCIGCEDTTIQDNCISSFLPGVNHSGFAEEWCAACMDNLEADVGCDVSPMGPTTDSATIGGIDVIALDLKALNEDFYTQFYSDFDDIKINRNIIAGGGDRAAIRVLDTSPENLSKDLWVTWNSIIGWRMLRDTGSMADIDVSGYNAVVIADNTLIGRCSPAHVGACAWEDEFGIRAQHLKSVGTDVAIERNTLQHRTQRITGINPSDLPSAIGVRGFESVAIRQNELACVSGSRGFQIGTEDAMTLAWTGPGKFTENEIINNFSCHPDVVAPPATLVAGCVSACEFTSSGNMSLGVTFDVPLECQKICSP